MTMICRAADDKTNLSVCRLRQEPELLGKPDVAQRDRPLHRLSDANQKLNVTGPKESCKRYADLAKKERFAFDKDGNKFSDMKLQHPRRDL